MSLKPRFSIENIVIRDLKHVKENGRKSNICRAYYVFNNSRYVRKNVFACDGRYIPIHDSTLRKQSCKCKSKMILAYMYVNVSGLYMKNQSFLRDYNFHKLKSKRRKTICGIEDEH